MPPVRRRYSLAAAALLVPALLAAQQIDDPANLTGEHVAPQFPADTLPVNHGAAALQQLLLKLRSRASLMLIVAHPDDEDGGLLTYASRGLGARVGMLTLTRGEGGQNLMTADFNEALGLIRTQELLAADRYFGSNQFFGTEIDFGFSKTKEETLAQWTHDRVLYDAVRAVRLYRPLVLASVFVGGPTDGHGHHQVAGEITQEVFLAAADPHVFPEMIQQGLLPWAPLKVYARIPFSRVTDQGMFDYATGQTVPTLFHNYVTGADTHNEPVATVTIPEGTPATVTFPGHAAAPTLGMEGLTYVQFARKGLALQKTQIGDNVRLAPAGAFDVGYTLKATRLDCSQPHGSGCPILSGSIGKGGVSGESPTVSPLPAHESSLFAGIDTTLPGLATLAPSAPASLRETLLTIDHNIEAAQRAFDPTHLASAATPLQSALAAIDNLIRETEHTSLPTEQRANLLHELRIKRVQLNDALLLALNITLTPRLRAHSPFVTANQHITVDIASLTTSLPKWDLRLEIAPGIVPPKQLAQRLNDSLSVTLDADPTPTRPYFYRAQPDQPFYSVTNPALRNAPETPPPFVERLTTDYQGTPFELRAVVTTPPTATQPPAPAVVVPAATVAVTPAAGIVRLDSPSVNLRIVPVPPGKTTVISPPGWRQTYYFVDQMSRSMEELYTLRPTHPQPGETYTFTAATTLAGHQYRESYLPIGYPGIPATNLYFPATYRATAVNVQVAPVRVAYLPGTGDSVPDFLPDLGIHPTLIIPADLTASSLARFDTVVLGVRAYSRYPQLAGTGSKALLDFARTGGTVLVQYNSGGFDPSSAPYPYTLPGDSAHNVVVEADPVQLLDPTHPLLTFPNRITPADFDNWSEERGHGFASTWDPHYTALLETHDPGQAPQRGGLLFAPVGKGAYIYCALALYRQLPESVPGAYRLLANLLSYPRHP